MKDNFLLSVLVVMCLVVGGLTGFLIGDKPVEIKEIVKEIPVNNTIVTTEYVTEYIAFDYLESAKSDFLSEVKRDKDIDVLGRYSYNEMSVKRINDEYTINYLDEDKYEVLFSIDLKFKESDSESEIESYDVKVTYEEGEKPLVELM